MTEYMIRISGWLSIVCYVFSFASLVVDNLLNALLFALLGFCLTIIYTYLNHND